LFFVFACLSSETAVMIRDSMQTSSSAGSSPFSAHQRDFSANRYVYPVLSRRAGGVSVGVNLNPDKFCNFRCIYCQIDRTMPSEAETVDLDRLSEELDRMVEEVASGRIFEGPRFRNTPPSFRRFNDIAFSGDGEPTACPNFDRAVDVCAEIRRRRKLDDVKLVLITNATLFHQPRVREALRTLDENNGEIWAKLDAGTEGYYEAVDRSAAPWRRILDNLREAALARPIVIQSLFLRMHDQAPPSAELEAYCERLREIAATGGRIKLVQVHTIARLPTEPWATALADAEVDAIADMVRCRTELPVAAFYGNSGQ
jgi:wyosine [tRNA(Phe)-imidazoG37] synthetase (radical SAM superfamily)